jgi:alkylation response protein AidB-like acyl-CoA dehydrogenase
VSSLGIAGAALDFAVDYAKNREQFGQAIIDFQGLQFLLAEMTMQLAAGWSLFEQAVSLLDQGPSRHASTYVSMAKLLCSDVGMKVTTDAVQVLGGYGLSKEYPVERLMRDAKAFQIFDGTNQIQKTIIGKYLRKVGVPVGSGGPRSVRRD